MRIRAAMICMSLCLACSAAEATSRGPRFELPKDNVYVREYTTKRGTVVPAHFRTRPAAANSPNNPRKLRTK